MTPHTGVAGQRAGVCKTDDILHPPDPLAAHRHLLYLKDSDRGQSFWFGFSECTFGTVPFDCLENPSQFRRVVAEAYHLSIGRSEDASWKETNTKGIIFYFEIGDHLRHIFAPAVVQTAE